MKDIKGAKIIDLKSMTSEEIEKMAEEEIERANKVTANTPKLTKEEQEELDAKYSDPFWYRISCPIFAEQEDED